MKKNKFYIPFNLMLINIFFSCNYLIESNMNSKIRNKYLKNNYIKYEPKSYDTKQNYSHSFFKINEPFEYESLLFLNKHDLEYKNRIQKISNILKALILKNKKKQLILDTLIYLKNIISNEITDSINIKDTKISKELEKKIICSKNLNQLINNKMRFKDLNKKFNIFFKSIPINLCETEKNQETKETFIFYNGEIENYNAICKIIDEIKINNSLISQDISNLIKIYRYGDCFHGFSKLNVANKIILIKNNNFNNVQILSNSNSKNMIILLPSFYYKGLNSTNSESNDLYLIKKTLNLPFSNTYFNKILKENFYHSLICLKDFNFKIFIGTLKNNKGKVYFLCSNNSKNYIPLFVQTSKGLNDLKDICPCFEFTDVNLISSNLNEIDHNNLNLELLFPILSLYNSFNSLSLKSLLNEYSMVNIKNYIEIKFYKQNIIILNKNIKFYKEKFNSNLNSISFIENKRMNLNLEEKDYNEQILKKLIEYNKTNIYEESISISSSLSSDSVDSFSDFYEFNIEERNYDSISNYVNEEKENDSFRLNRIKSTPSNTKIIKSFLSNVDKNKYFNTFKNNFNGLNDNFNNQEGNLVSINSESESSNIENLINDEYKSPNHLLRNFKGLFNFKNSCKCIIL
ncbi:MAG: hypothetical protein GY823_06350 [Flavobacteriaceae bacterium]|nr:hypothetical protein [Flavobacteriaceae bacterium]